MSAEPLDDLKEAFEAWVRKEYRMHEKMLRPGKGHWAYDEIQTLFMLDAFRAGVRSQLPDSTD